MKVVAFLPAKGSSERVENKNTKLLDGKPLFLHTLEKLMHCDFIDEVYLDSESEEIFALASNVNAKFLRRDRTLASNKTDGHQLFHNEAKKVSADIYIQILCTSPFIKIETIKKGVEVLKNSSNYDSVVLMRKEKQYLWSNGQPLYDKDHIPNSIDLPDSIIETMGLYIVRKEIALSKKMRFGDNVFFLEADATEAIDVNYPDDFILASFIAAGMREKERQLFKNLNSLLTSSILSDILDDLGMPDNITSKLSLNLPNKKILGRAKTLKLRRLEENEDYQGIYRALDSYATIIPNDIIVVENECSEFAYFGELNANLAIRAGAVAAIIDGKTRDTKGVSDLDFPVFAKQTTCKDVRKRATVESINKKISLCGIEVTPGDLIFGDNDGIVVIPSKYETLIINKALETLNKEKNVLLHITTGYSTDNILKNTGGF
ncbi:cytidyltransferase|uniref:CMP-N-acetylneuraminic acid synthetase n=1 Tax=Dendrosporobacter quercicolus TaxID=146817 RepID=A0A1G9WWN5_9FIRM|nr:cytidyltransferase [Dendrosporobacter quercicolus]NSL49226.1 cytidyltransferase [Dendrosporobacter quercicolus DSM 1736]SDM88485.1 CMP-N-acetylneuraminic acid synthetase [Dendrosporobacter quercicolus]